MTLIKRSSAIARHATGFRPLSHTIASTAATDASSEVEAVVVHDPRDDAIEQLNRRVADLEAELSAAHRNTELACEAMLERGRAEGTESAATLERERTDALVKGIEDAVAAIEGHIERNRDVAIDLARAALDRLFADPSLYHGMVVEAARRQASALARGTIARLRVSTIDFPDPAALDGLTEFGPDVRVEADPSLPSGSCLFDLSLGALDASIARQASVIEGVFAQAESTAIRAERKAASA